MFITYALTGEKLRLLSSDEKPSLIVCFDNVYCSKLSNFLEIKLAFARKRKMIQFHELWHYPILFYYLPLLSKKVLILLSYQFETLLVIILKTMVAL